jgi:D-lactate dehydrogenase
MFGSAGPGVGGAFDRLCDRAGVAIRAPDGIASLCCGTPWKSKGLTRGHVAMRNRVLPALWDATERGVLPVVVDAASCTEGLRGLLAQAGAHPTPLTVVDAVEFVDEQILPRLPPAGRLPSLAVHPTCSSIQIGAHSALLRVAAAVAEEVVVPEDWSCCGFAGDLGLLRPELTAAATRAQAQSVRQRSFAAYASTNRTCELGMTRATGRPYRHILEILEEVTRPPSTPGSVRGRPP